MRAKEYMSQAVKLNRLIENKIEESNMLRYRAEGTSSASLSDRVQGCGDPQRMATCVAAYVDMQREIDEDIDRYVELKRDITRTIEQLPATEYDLLHMVYLQGRTLQEVASRHDRSYSWATTMHRQALQRLQRILEKSLK